MEMVSLKTRKRVSIGKKSADQNRADSLNKIGRCYATGFGVKKDLKKAFHYFELAIKQKNSYAEDNISNFYLLGLETKKDAEIAYHLIQLAATDKDNCCAQYYFGKCLINGEGFPRNLNKANKHFAVATKGFLEDVAQSDADDETFNCLGECYEGGHGVPVNLKKAIHCYCKSADSGYPHGCLNLARCYYLGIGVAKNIQLAKKYYILSGEQTSMREAFKKAA
jgi:TPR repeat protein